MKNIRLSVYLLFFIGAFVISAPHINARVYSQNDCCQTTCCEPIYDCGCPLNCGSLNIWLRAGVAPLSWRDRGDFSAIACNALAIPGFSQDIVPILHPLPQFKKFFHLPWIVGGQIGYAFTDCFEAYVEFNFRSASRRVFTQTGITIPNDVVTVVFTFDHNYRVFDAYVGGRFYWGRYWCDRIAIFFGAKFGLVHHRTISLVNPSTITSTACPVSLPLVIAPGNTTVPFFLKNTRPAAGVCAGFDWCLGCGWSFMVMGEIVASCGPKSNGNGNIVVPSNCAQLPSILPSNLIVGSTGTELFFPVTFGFKYNF
jgi:hypothetical protein